MGPHRIIEPEGLAPARGYSHAVAAAAGRSVWVAGQMATDETGTVVGTSFAEQFDRALANVVTSLRAAGAEPHHVVNVHIFTTDVEHYLSSLAELAPVYRRYMGAHYPAMALLGVSALVDPDAVVEITATAVVPDD